MTSPSHSALNLVGSRRNAVSASASNASSEGALTVRHASGSADIGSVMAPVLGESGQAAKARASCFAHRPIDGADVDGRAAMGERRPDQRLEEKMTRTITVIVVMTSAAMLGLAAPSAGFAQSTSAPKKNAAATEFSAQSRPEPGRARTRIR